MAKPKGLGKSGGRQAGTPNKSTSLAREAIARFVEDNTQRMQGWLDDIAADSPEKAFNCVRDLMEYHLPKLSRQDTNISGKVELGISGILDSIDGSSADIPE